MLLKVGICGYLSKGKEVIISQRKQKKLCNDQMHFKYLSEQPTKYSEKPQECAIPYLFLKNFKVKSFIEGLA